MRIISIVCILLLTGCINPRFRNGTAYYDKTKDNIYFLFENNQGEKEAKIELKPETTNKLRDYICNKGAK